MLPIGKLNYIVLALCIFIHISGSIAQDVVSVKKYTREEVSAAFKGEWKEGSDFTTLKMVYTTTNHNGEGTIASGLVFIPNLPDVDKTPIAVFAHGTTTKRRYVTSELNFQAAYASNLVLNNYITIAPDYLGLGDGPGLHPYLHAETEATAILDMIRAVRNYFQDSLKITMRKDVYFTGYSQGGHAVMAAHKYIEENNLTDEFQVNASAPCSGPYSMSKVMYNYVLYLNEISYCDPEIMVHTIISNQYVYENLYEKTGDYFIAPYDSIIDAYLAKDCDFDLNAHFPAELSGFIRDSILQSWIHDPDNSFIRDLGKNDVDNWKPEAPVKMYYTKADVKVPHESALKALEEMKNRGATDVEAIEVSAELGHDQVMGPAMQLVLDWFNETELAITIQK